MAPILALVVQVRAAPSQTSEVDLPVEQIHATDSGVSLLSSSRSELRTAQVNAAPSRRTGSFIDVPPPAVADFWLTARRTPEGRVILDGYVPSQSARDALAADPAVDPASLELAGGEPEGFAEALTFGLERLARMSEGRFSLRSNVLTLAGTASTLEDHATLSYAAGVPAGFVLARNEILPPSVPPVAEGDETPDEVATSTAEPAPVPAGEITAAPPLPVADPYVWSADRTSDGVVTLAGHVPGEPLRRVLMIRAGEGAVDTTQFAAGAPEGFILDTRAAMDALAVLAEGRVAFDGAQWSVSGTFAEDRGREALNAALSRAATDAAAWSVAVERAQPPAMPADGQQMALGQSAPDASSQNAVPAEALEECRLHLALFSAQNAILFRSGSAALAPTSEPVLAELAGYVAACPDLPVYIEGHTDADGAATANLALSVARAEAVVTALVGLGIAPNRLYAVGYGESAPVAPNDTPQGKQLNRRIVVSLDSPE
ncbi:hypothetical protein GCM10010862_35130 [Devosia nitrariae]|uniref:OmpA-like domain-containing protein n=1 Tax=Devosia nitrariae TaxID=2071872 RepID=A0ABQ5W8U8_9HYPH|nr:hypothetical protein GCM10010862_35130 [Devosia nitrariae]